MTLKLTIKNLNCGNCPGPCPVLFGSFFEGRAESEMAPITKAVGCASHPLALQVMAAPVIEELEKRNKQDPTLGIGVPTSQKKEGYREAINLLKEGVKKP